MPKQDKGRSRMARLRYERIDVDELSRLTIDHCDKKKIDPEYEMTNELGEMIFIIVEKMLGGSQYRGYTPDWKEEMRGKAYEHTVKYIKNFNITKVKAGQYDAAFNYYAMIITNAFKQAIKQQKAYTEKNKILNDAYGYNQAEMESDRSMVDSSYIYPDESRLDYGTAI